LEVDGHPEGLCGREGGPFSWGYAGWVEESWCTWIDVSVERPVIA